MDDRDRWRERTYLYQFCTDTECSLEDLGDWWMIETDGEGESGKSMLSGQLNEDDDDLYKLHNFFLPKNDHFLKIYFLRK